MTGDTAVATYKLMAAAVRNLDPEHLLSAVNSLVVNRQPELCVYTSVIGPLIRVTGRDCLICQHREEGFLQGSVALGKQRVLLGPEFVQSS